MITGTDGRDQINGTDAADLISGLGGGDRVNAGGGEDVIIAGSGARNILNGGEDGDLFVFDAAIAEDRARDSYYLRDFDAAEDQIDLGGAEVSRVSDGNGFVRLFLEGGRDFILVYNVDGIEEISFVDEGLV
jgi:Ca2+-binding RTX toxin-like protein